jgi:hypothetical protein
LIQAPTASIDGLATTANGDVWSGQYVFGSGFSQIVVNAKGCGAVVNTLTDPVGSSPVAIAFDSKGNAYVANLFGPGLSGPGNVAVYPPGATSPSTTLTNSDFYGVSGVAVDSKDNVYVSYSNPQPVCKVIEFPGGAGPGTILNLTGHSNNTFGLTFDKHQNLILNDGGPPGQEEVYAPPYNGAPAHVLVGVANSQPIAIALNARGNLLYTADINNYAVNVYAYPSGKYVYSINAGFGTSQATYALAVSR